MNEATGQLSEKNKEKRKTTFELQWESILYMFPRNRKERRAKASLLRKSATNQVGKMRNLSFNWGR